MGNNYSDTQRTLSDNYLPGRIKTLLAYLNRNLSGKDEAVSLTLLSAIAGESILMLGSSGQDKIEVVRCVAAAFRNFYGSGYECFEYFMNGSSTPDNLQISGKTIAFLDDIWAASPAVLNKLLRIINDSPVFVAAGSKEADPYKAAEDRRFEALRESFALHVSVNTASSDEAFFRLINTVSHPRPNKEQETALLDQKEIQNWQQTKIGKVELGEDAKNIISEVRRKMIDYFVSDFRWRKIVRVLKTCAFLNGRNQVDLIDCSLIDYAIPGQVVEGILKQKVIDGKLDSKQHAQYKENIFARHKYYQILKTSVNDKKLQMEQKLFNN